MFRVWFDDWLGERIEVWDDRGIDFSLSGLERFTGKIILEVACDGWFCTIWDCEDGNIKCHQGRAYVRVRIS